MAIILTLFVQKKEQGAVMYVIALSFMNASKDTKQVSLCVLFHKAMRMNNFLYRFLLLYYLEDLWSPPLYDEIMESPD